MGVVRRFFWSVLVIILAPVAAVLGWASYLAWSMEDAQLRMALTRPSLLVRVVKHNGRPAGYGYGCACDRPLRPDEVPQTLRSALIAAEDRGFPRHVGISLAGLARAVLSRGDVGGSTLTQQLAKLAVTGDRNRLPHLRKLVEIILALRIERLWTKDEILALYLSHANFGTVGGSNIVGLRSAAQVWFGKPPEALGPAEAALLVAMLNAPSQNNPLRNPERTLARARYVLARMAEDGHPAPIGPAELARALPRAPRARPFRDRFIEDRLIAEFRPLMARMQPGFYRLVSSIDPIAQYQARRVLARGVARARRSGVRRAALVTLDPAGRLVAMIGGLDYARSQFNLALNGRRQAGSTAKIATYLAALEAGYGPNSLVEDDPAKLSGFVPRNNDRRHRGTIPLAECLVESRNLCTTWLARRVGLDAVAEMARRIGLYEPGVPGDLVVLGVAETSPIRLAGAYATLTNGGRVARPSTLALVIGAYGRLVHVAPPRLSPPVLPRRVIAPMRALLRRVVLEGTGRHAAFAGARAFGKTGTTQENRDAWFAGFTEHGFTTVIWVGPAEGGRMRGIAGGNLPAELFAQYNASMVERFAAFAAGADLHR